MAKHDSFPTVTPVSAVLLDARRVSGGGSPYVQLDLAAEGQRVAAISFDSDEEWLDRLSGPLTSQVFDLMALPGQKRDAVVGIGDDHLYPALWHLPADLCPVEGVLPAVQALIHDVQAAPLKTFLLDVFARRDMHKLFWTAPASIRHHHAYPGGLAVHSMEVATDIAQHVGLSDIERDLGTTAGLLHDVGKVWAYTPDMQLTTAARAMGHELLGLSRLEPYLRDLERHWPDGAWAMRVLLSGQCRMRADGSLPHSLVQRLRACDQRSAEIANQSDRQRQRPVWTPRPCPTPTHAAAR